MHKHSHLGIYAVVENDRGQILLIKKARGPYTGLLDLPGGSMDEGELLEETLRREISEETGLKLIGAKQLCAISIRYAYSKEGQPAELRHIGIIYAAQVGGTVKETGDGEDSNGAQWMDKSTLKEKDVTPFVWMAIKGLL